MKIKLTFILFLILSACGIDKESPPPLASISNSGELDLSFFSTGYYSIDGSAGQSNGQDEIHDMIMDGEGRILAVGSSVNSSLNLDMVIWRLTASGTLDSSFSGNGTYVHDNAAGGSGDDIGYSITVDSSNNIYVTGTSMNGAGNFDMAVWKITESGALDSSFNGSGVFVHNNAAGGNLNDQGNKIKIDNSQNIVVVGYSDQSATNRDLAIWKMDETGVLDTSFDADGFLTQDGSAGGEDDVGNSFDFDTSGNLIVVGQGESVSNLGDMVVWKYSSTGVLDSSFNSTGIFSHNGAAGGNGFDSANDIAIDHDGNYIITGYSRNNDGNTDMALWKLLPNGSFDTSFAQSGIGVFDVSDIHGGSSNDTGQALLIDGARNLLVVGNGNQDMCIWRLDENGELDSNFNVDGFFSHDSAAGGFGIDSGFSVVEDIFERIYIGGASENNSGDFDATFWRMK